jgi:peptidyl-prolyl cis-trans isomerase A (cyclophilin A)
MIRNVILASVIGLGAVLAQAQTVKVSTTQGDIVIQLDAAKAPKTVANFLSYVKSGHYNGTIFHRVIKDFMIQGGGMTEDMREKPTLAPIPLESGNGLSNVRGTIAMARTNVPDSAAAQFFINGKDNLFLNATGPNSRDGYAVFGKVIKGMDVVDKILATATTRKGPYSDVPATPIFIKQASIEK